VVEHNGEWYVREGTMESKEVFTTTNAALKVGESAFTIFEGIANNIPENCDQLMRYSINASLCEFMGALNRLGVSCMLLFREYERAEKRATLEKEAKKALKDLSEPQTDKAQTVPVVKGEP
jgi:hypothetical protein